VDLHSGTPFWPRRNGILGVHPPLSADVSCEVVVVGAGITGSLIALELTSRGLDVVVLDRRDAGGGSTSASTSMLQYEIDELLIDLADSIGTDAAALAYQECSRGIDLVERATQTIGHNCGFRRSPSVFMAIRKRDVKTLQREYDARVNAGFDVQFLDRDALDGRWGLEAVAAIESVAGASVDPYALCYRALRRSVEWGASVHDRTQVDDYQFSTRRVRLSTDRGHTVTAKHAVIATGYEVETLLPELPMALHSSFALVTEPIDDLHRYYPNGLLFWDFDDPYLYGRTTDDGRLLVGGKDESYKDPLRRRRAMPSKIRALTNAVPRRLTRIGQVEVAFSWAGTFAETPDGLAYIGGHSKYPRCQFALGFGGNGITYSALAAQYIADSITGSGSTDGARLFQLERPIIRPS
jgi:glycine/D-amino acid oxidase-like deaminating enzyme